MNDLVEKLHQLESEEDVVTATLSMGFPFADIYNAGVSVLVTTDGNHALAEKKVEEFARHIWSIRETFRMNLVSIEEAIEHANQSEGQPIILAEASDNPGGGGPCDGTFILRAFVEADVQECGGRNHCRSRIGGSSD